MFRNPLKALSDRAMLRDQPFYAAAMNELKSGRRRDGLWAMALVQAAGKTENVESTYLRLLVETIKQEDSARATGRLGQDLLVPRDPAVASMGAPIKPGRDFYYLMGGKEYGPITGAEMKRLANRLPALTKIRTSEMDGWSDILRMSPILDSI